MHAKGSWWRLICAGFGWLLLTTLPVAKGSEFSVDIVADTGQRQEEEPTLTIDGVFYVVLTNISDKPIRIFEDWSSWGMFSLSFEGIGTDGKTYKFERDQHVIFNRNFPATFEIRPQGHYVFRVDFAKDKWPMLWWFRYHSPSDRFLLKTVFAEVDQRGDHKVWQGTVESEARWFKFFFY